MWRAKTGQWPRPLRSVRSRWLSWGAAPEPPRRVAALSGNGDYGRLGLGALESRWPPAAAILCRRPAAPAMLHLQKHLRIPFRHQRLFSVNLLFATTAASEASPNHAPFAIEDYLVATCGLTRDKAVKASKTLSHLKSPSKPDAVLAFLSGLGLSPSDIASIVASDPRILCCNVKILAPRLAAIQEEHGLSTSQIARFFLRTPFWVRRSAIISKLQFFVPFFGSFDNFLLAMKKSPYFLTSNLERVVKPNVSVLSEYGISAPDISKVCLKKPGLLLLPSSKLQAMAAWVEDIGIPRGKPMFQLALQCVACRSEKSIAAKMDLLKKVLQCSGAEVMTLLSRSPGLLTISLDRIQRVSRFLISEVGFDPKYIASKPGLMTFSLEGRLMPRFYVVKFLREKGLLGRQLSYYYIISLKEKDFVGRFIHPFKGAAPHLAEDYAAACRGEVPSSFRSQEPRTGLPSV